RLDPQLQPKLVKLLDAGVLRQAGDAREVSVDVRLIAATSTDLVDAVNAGRFREDLYYRLGVMPIHLPPLRARSREDLLDLIARLTRELERQLVAAPGEI